MSKKDQRQKFTTRKEDIRIVVDPKKDEQDREKRQEQKGLGNA
jgi:hypothetical protein